MENVSPYDFRVTAENSNVRKGGINSLRTFSLLKGLPVLDLTTGTKIGEVCDLSITSNGMVKGLIVKKGALFKKTYVIDIENVNAFGWDGIMVSTIDVLQPMRQPAEFTFESRQGLNGKMMMSCEGEKLGILEDVYFMEELGTIVGYECSDGFFSDMTEGKRVINTTEPPAIGKDTIIVNVNEKRANFHSQK